MEHGILGAFEPILHTLTEQNICYYPYAAINTIKYMMLFLFGFSHIELRIPLSINPVETTARQIGLMHEICKTKSQ